MPRRLWPSLSEGDRGPDSDSGPSGIGRRNPASSESDEKLPEREYQGGAERRAHITQPDVGSAERTISRSGSFPHPYDRHRDREWDRDPLDDWLRDEEISWDRFGRAGKPSGDSESYW